MIMKERLQTYERQVLEIAHISSALKNLVTKINLGSREARKYSSAGWPLAQSKLNFFPYEPLHRAA